MFCEAGRLCRILETEFWPVLHLGVETTGCLGCSDVTRTQPVENNTNASVDCRLYALSSCLRRKRKKKKRCTDEIPVDTWKLMKKTSWKMTVVSLVCRTEHSPHDVCSWGQNYSYFSNVTWFFFASALLLNDTETRGKFTVVRLPLSKDAPSSKIVN